MVEPLNPLQAQVVDRFNSRNANFITATKLLERIPNAIEGSTDKTSPENLRWMLTTVLEDINTFPLDKTGRWIGFVQGVLALSGHLNVDDERDATRNIYQEAYRLDGIVIPPTRERT